MHSFGLVVPSSPSSCSVSRLVGSESSCAQNGASEESMDHNFDGEHNLPPPPLLSLSEAAPYTSSGTCCLSEVAAYCSSEGFSPVIQSPPRFPPPPSSTYPNMTFFESLPASHYSCELRASDPRGPPYYRWSDSGLSVGLDNSSKFVSYWPFPGLNSHKKLTKHCPTKSEGLYPAISASPQYPVCDSTNKSFSSKFSSVAQEFNTSLSSPNVVIPSSSFASVCTPHLSSFPAPNLPFDFPRPTTSRFSFNPHASAFYPGKDPQTCKGPYIEDISYYNGPLPNSHLASASILCSPYQGVESFHDGSPRPMNSPEIPPRPIKPTSTSFFSSHDSVSGSSATSSNPIFAAHSLCSRSNSVGPVCSDGSGSRESLCDFPSSSSLPFEMPVTSASATLLNFYNTEAASPLSGKLKCPRMEEDDTVERFFSESGTLLYPQHMSPEEWRWNHYEPLYAQGSVDPTGCFPRNRHPTYNYFQNRYQAGPSCVSEAVRGDTNSLFAVNVVERSKLPNQSGSSLQLAASALAEMLALKSNGAPNSSSQSTTGHIASLSGSAVASDVLCESEGLRLPGSQERLPDDCCSSSGSVPVHKDANLVSNGETPSRGAVEGGTVRRPHSSEIFRKRESVHHVDDVLEDVTSDLNCVPVTINSTSLNAFGQSQSCTSTQPLTCWLSQSVGPQVAVTKSVFPGAYNAISRGAIQSSSTGSTGCGVIQDLNLESVISQNLNPLFTQSLDVSQKAESGRCMKVTTQPVGALSSEDTSIVGPFRSCVVACGPFMAGPCHEATSSPVKSQVPVNSSNNDCSPANSQRIGTSPLLSHSHIETPRCSLSTMDDGVASRVPSSVNGSSPQTPNVMHISGFQSLTTSISNLTKVLLAFDSSMLPQGDSTLLQESLQGAILRLSECLLLEQASLGPRSSGINVGGSCAINESADRERASKNEPLEFSDLFSAAGASGSKLESSKLGVLEEGPTLAKTKQGHSLYETTVKTSSDRVEIDKTSLEVNGSQKINFSMENFDNASKHSFLGPSANMSHFTINPEEVHSSEPRLGRVHDILEFLGDQNRLDLTALKNLVAAEAREEELKCLVQHLREKLEFEREENKGTAYLCEKIMQEADVVSSRVQVESRHAAEGASASSGGHAETSNENVGSSTPKTSSSATALKSKQPSSSGFDGVQARLAVLQGRRAWDTEIGFFTETEPCTPDNFSSTEVWNGGREGFSGPKPCVIDTMDLGKSSPLITPQMVSQVQKIRESPLLQSELLSNMDTAWNQYYDVLDLQYMGFDSEKEVEERETRSGIATHICGHPRSVEARAQLIRSRSNLMNIDGAESCAGNLDDNLDWKLSHDSVGSGSPVFENHQYETMDEICLVRLLDSDGENPQPAVTRKTSSRLQGDDEVGGMAVSLKSDGEAVKDVIQAQDMEDEAGWEHVRLPRQDSD